jgi:hypothetical protein
MSRPFTEIKEALATIAEPYEHPRPSINWFDAIDDDGRGANGRQPTPDFTPAALCKDRPGKKGIPKKK